jgi:polysaccharide pyruvyl transferase WcaK-like protein
VRICVVGNFSGRNAGDAAILGGLLRDLTEAYGRFSYDIPTINPDFVRRSYVGHDVNAVGLLPWNLSAKILGWPIIRSILRSDLVLVTDAILFDRQLFNPLYNYLFTMSLVLPLARSTKIPDILYNVSLGPARTGAGKACLRRVLDAANEIILRDEESLGEVPAGGTYSGRIRRGADCALSVAPPQREVVDRIIEAEDLRAGGRPYLTCNINSYIDVFVRGRGERVGIEEFAALMGEAINDFMSRIDANVVFVITQPMDTKITRLVMSHVTDVSRMRLVTNSKYTYQELVGVFSQAEIHVGMRTHSLILASSVCTPVVGILSTPKNRGYMRSIRQEARMIEFEDLTARGLADRVWETWSGRAAIREELTPIIEGEKRKAAAAAEYLRPYLGHAGARRATAR